MSLSREEISDIVSEVVKEALQPLRTRLNELDENFKKLQRQRNLALVTALVCLIAASFSAGYGIQSREQAQDSQAALEDQIDFNQQQLCSSARSTALAFRFPQVSKNGKPETDKHFLDRMIGQRDSLLRAQNLRCPSLPGFDTFPYLRAKALAEIENIIMRLASPHLQEELGLLPNGRDKGTIESGQGGTTLDPGGHDASEGKQGPIGQVPSGDSPSKGGGGNVGGGKGDGGNGGGNQGGGDGAGAGGDGGEQGQPAGETPKEDLPVDEEETESEQPQKNAADQILDGAGNTVKDALDNVCSIAEQAAGLCHLGEDQR